MVRQAGGLSEAGGLAGAWFSLLRHRLEIEEARVNGERGPEFAWRKHMVDGAPIGGRRQWHCARRRGWEAVINATGVYAQLVAAHVGERGAATSASRPKTRPLRPGSTSRPTTLLTSTDALARLIPRSRRRPSVARPTPPCRPSKASAARVPGLWRSGSVRRGPLWAALQAERAGVAAKGREIDTEAAPIRYVAAIFGVADQETAIRWLIALMVLRCDAPAIATVAAALAPQHSSSAQNRSPTDRSALVEFAPTSRSTPGKS